MCQIISLEGERVNVISYLLKNKNKIKESLDFKGGEGYSLTFLNNTNAQWFSTQSNDYEELFEDSIERLIKEPDYGYCYVILFSRQRPEMEEKNVSLPPYWDEEQEHLVWMHGTISNVEELEKKYNIKVNVDSEILLYAKEEEIEGNFSAIIADIYKENKSVFVRGIDNGLGLYYYNEENINICTTDINYKSRTISKCLKTNKNLIVSYSGGMDVTMSLIKQLELYKEMNYQYDNIYLIYFDYGARARDQEITSLFKMEKYLKTEYPDINIEAKVLEVRGLIQDISMIYQQQIKLIDEKASADEREAESTLAYIPFRNTIFMELLATFAEGKNLEKTDFLIGLNLSEGMVYLDNSEIWLHKINDLLPRAGKKYHKYWEVIAPYYNKTKINMLKDIYKTIGKRKFNKLLEISFSCYYPKENGEPCGKCGSCLLRQKALKEIEK